MEFTNEQWYNIKSHCEDVGVEFLSSPFSLAAVDLLESLDVKKYKIGSGEVLNFLMLEKIAKTKKPILLSSGMSSYKDLDDSIEFLNSFDSDISILQCNTEYPTPAKNVGLNIIQEMLDKYKLPVGLSDHSGEIFPSIAAVSLGASIIEVHTVFNKNMFGPDSSSSLSIEQLDYLVKGMRFIEESINNPVNKDDNKKFDDLKIIFEKSLAVNKIYLRDMLFHFLTWKAKSLLKLELALSFIKK